jgi:Fe-S cluster assembly iron-binding protein IscA
MVSKQNKINKDLVQPPIVMFTERALNQLKLIIENDFTLAGKYFRLLVAGKGCDGFTYSAGFTDLGEDDFLVPIHNSPEEILIAIDPFAAFYLQESSVDFIQDFDQDTEGFVITNHSQKDFHGKFWKTSPEKTPPLKGSNKNA